MPNPEIIVKSEGKAKWLNAAKAGAAVQIIPLTQGGMRASVTRHQQAVMNDDGSFNHWKTTQEPDTSVTLSFLWRNAAGALLNNAANGFEIKDAGKSAAYGTLSWEAASGGIVDVWNFPNMTLMSYTISTAREGLSCELTFAGVGEPTFGAVTLAGTEVVSTNTEIMVAAETYAKWKGIGKGAVASTVKTLGFIGVSGSWRLSVSFQKLIVRNSAGQFSHVKSVGDAQSALSITKMIQDYQTELLADDQDGFATKGQTGAVKSTAQGTIAVEGRYADGTTIESIQLSAAVLSSYGRNPGREGDTLDLSFTKIGLPTFAAATLAA